MLSKCSGSTGKPSAFIRNATWLPGKRFSHRRCSGRSVTPKFFHWELAFPDVFTGRRSGFDAMVGNPPWDVIEPNSQEFFTEFDPLYRTYNKQAALHKQTELFATVPSVAEQWGDYIARFKAQGNWARNAADPFDLALARGKEGTGLAVVWAKHRQGRIGFADKEHPFRLLGTGKQNAYKLFCETFWSLLQHDGRLGVILPTGIYSDFGTKDLREALLFKGRLEFLYAFQNEKKIFAAADHRYKQVAVFATRGGSTEVFQSRFRMGVGDSPQAHEIPDDILRSGAASMVFTPDDVRLNSPKTLTLVELRTQRDLAIFRKIYSNSIRIGDNAVGWEITYAQEINMTSDSTHFPPLEKWEANGYKHDVFGRWIGQEGDVAVPLYQGAMVYYFNPVFQFFGGGSGRVNQWVSSSTDGLVFQPKYLIAEGVARNLAPSASCVRIAIRDITSNTNERTLVASVVTSFPCGHTLPVLTMPNGSLDSLLALSAAMSSLVCDYVARARMTGSHMSYFILQDVPFPSMQLTSESVQQLVTITACLTFLHRRFAAEWLRLKHLYPELAAKEWKHWWAVTEADRLRLRVEIDALCADLYGLEPDDFDWIVRDDPKDPKGFYRVDRKLPFRERLTGLSAAAFRALKEGKWSAESAAKLSNDEFFGIIGIPELTSPVAAKGKNLPEPLILKRAGCHKWEPEKFLPTDSRFGWTWKDCWNDAVALLGSEEAVRDYVEGTKDQSDEKVKYDGPTDLFGNPIPLKPKQGKLF
jgi:hypothetical protein